MRNDGATETGFFVAVVHGVVTDVAVVVGA